MFNNYEYYMISIKLQGGLGNQMSQIFTVPNIFYGK